MRALTKWIAFCIASLFSAAAFAAMMPDDTPTSAHGAGADQDAWLHKDAGPGHSGGAGAAGAGGGL